MARDYVERREDSFYLIGSRVPLAHVVYEFRNGETPDGAITFYLENKEEVERDMIERRRIEEEFIKSQPPLPPQLKQKLERAREQMLAKRS